MKTITKINPSWGRALVKPNAPVQITKGGIHLPDKAQKTPAIGVVVALGDPDGDWEWQFGVGATILYSQYVGTTIQMNGEDMLLLSPRDILAELEEMDEETVTEGGIILAASVP
jgi:chaperonin GroES